jgi:hypothetical protein
MKSKPAASLLIHSAHENGLPVVIGCPVAADQLQADHGFASVATANGAPTRAQYRALTPVTPGGVRWIELSFLAKAKGAAVVTLEGEGRKPPEPDLARTEGPDILLDNGTLRVRLQTDPAQPPLRIEHCSGGKWKSVGTLYPDLADSQGQVHREPPTAVRKTTILRNGPIRGQVELSTAFQTPSGGPSFACRLTVELWANAPAVRIDWMLTHTMPGVQSIDVRRATLHGDWTLDGKANRVFRQTCYSEFYVNRDVENPAPVTILADDTCAVPHVSDPAMLLDDCKYAHYLAAPTIATDDWLALRSKSLAIHATVVDFCDTRPNALSSEGNHLDYHLIPDGKTLPWPQGRRKEQTLLLACTPAATPADEAVRLALSTHAFGRAVPTHAHLSAMRCFDMDRVLPYRPGRNVLLTRVLGQLCRLETPGSKWDIGDTPEPGYTRGYPGTPNCYHPLPGAPQMPRGYVTGGGFLYPASLALFVEPAWTNNEYDIIHCIATEVMRANKTDHQAMLRWTARHNVEVDFVSYSDDRWHHRASPFHSHFHNAKGAITSHFWTQGLLQYYALSGDRDALEVALALGDKIIEIDSSEARIWKFDREVGWALLALVCLCEAGYQQYRKEADRIVEFLQNYDRKAFTGKVNLSNAREGRTLERQMIDNGFGYSPMIEAIDRYQKLSGRADTAKWLKTILSQLKDELWNSIDEGEILRPYDMIGTVMAIGYERTGDEDFLLAGRVVLENIPDLMAMASTGSLKQNAMIYRGLCRYLGAADREGLLAPFEIPTVRKRLEAKGRGKAKKK